MQPLWLCLFSGMPFEETFKNAHWRWVKQMQSMILHNLLAHSLRRYLKIHEHQINQCDVFSLDGNLRIPNSDTWNIFFALRTHDTAKLWKTFQMQIYIQTNNLCMHVLSCASSTLIHNKINNCSVCMYWLGLSLLWVKQKVWGIPSLKNKSGKYANFPLLLINSWYLIQRGYFPFQKGYSGTSWKR